MQIIQGIRDKGTVIFSLVIAIALIGFILMSSEKGSGSKLFGGNTTAIGKINGSPVELSDFNARVDQEDDKQARQSGQQPTGTASMRIREQVWNQFVAESVFYKEADKLGITLTSKELTAILMSDDPSNPLLQERDLLDATGKLDKDKARDALGNIKKSKGDQRTMIDDQVIEPLRLSTAAAKYGGMISGSAYYPSWMKTRDEADAKNFAVISYAGIAYSELADSTVKVTDEDIDNYTAKHKDEFKQEAGRMISYLSFSENPSADDSAKTKQSLENLKTQFAVDTNAKSFTARNTSAIDFNDQFLPLSKITSVAKDSLVKLAPGTVYGPYVDGENYVLAKVIGVKQMPDSVKARHILIAINDLKTGQPIRSDSAAKKLADSVFAAIKGGADFAALASKYSASPEGQTKGGDLGTFGYGTMVPEFNDYAFSKNVGDMDVIKTQFGYHVIDVLSQSNFKPAFKIAYLAKPINASDETIDAAGIAATKASQSKNSAALAEYAAKNGLKLTDLPNFTVKENDFSLGNLQDARALVRWVFTAKKGDVSEPIPAGDVFVVATVNKIFSKGTQDAETARPMVEAAVRNQKKADIIIAKIGANPTPETAAAAYNKTVLTAGADSTINMNSRIINGIGPEPKVIGASFCAAFQTKPSGPIVGATGVYVIRVTSVQPKAPMTPEALTALDKTHMDAIRQSAGNWFEPLRDQADIKDNRSKFF